MGCQQVKPFQKITILPTHRDTDQILHVGLIQHPKVGWQLCSGSVENGEQPIDTAIRELREETGEIATVDQVKWLRKELADSPVLAEDLTVRGILLKRGWPILIDGERGGIAKARYVEYLGDRVDYEIAFEIPKDKVSEHIERHFFVAHLRPMERLERTVHADGHAFVFRYFPVGSLPEIGEPHSSRLDMMLALL